MERLEFGENYPTIYKSVYKTPNKQIGPSALTRMLGTDSIGSDEYQKLSEN
jgi:hypothetical protein